MTFSAFVSTGSPASSKPNSVPEASAHSLTPRSAPSSSTTSDRRVYVTSLPFLFTVIFLPMNVPVNAARSTIEAHASHDAAPVVPSSPLTAHRVGT